MGPDHRVQHPKRDVAHVLVVDDEEAARETLGAILEDTYRVSLASSGEKAVEILRKQEVDAVCTDLQMPGMSGIELLRQLPQISPRTVGILVTGYPELTADVDRHRGHLLVVKPYTTENLLRMVAQAVSFSRIRTLMAADATRSGSSGP